MLSLYFVVSFKVRYIMWLVLVNKMWVEVICYFQEPSLRAVYNLFSFFQYYENLPLEMFPTAWAPGCLQWEEHCHHHILQSTVHTEHELQICLCCAKLLRCVCVCVEEGGCYCSLIYSVLTGPLAFSWWYRSPFVTIELLGHNLLVWASFCIIGWGVAREGEFFQI